MFGSLEGVPLFSWRYHLRSLLSYWYLIKIFGIVFEKMKILCLRTSTFFELECSHSPGTDKLLYAEYESTPFNRRGASESYIYTQPDRWHSEQPISLIQGRIKGGNPSKSRHRCFSWSQYFPTSSYMNK